MFFSGFLISAGYFFYWATPDSCSAPHKTSNNSLETITPKLFTSSPFCLNHLTELILFNGKRSCGPFKSLIEHLLMWLNVITSKQGILLHQTNESIKRAINSKLAKRFYGMVFVNLLTHLLGINWYRWGIDYVYSI